ncbi:MAG: hypothetical protein MZV63_58720 [Marinilabiliales bacterium]|nr:hypothetical protein [Marinilabiliales bacterium]
MTVSLDTLRPDRFEKITRRTGLDRIFAGIARGPGGGPRTAQGQHRRHPRRQRRRDPRLRPLRRTGGRRAALHRAHADERPQPRMQGARRLAPGALRQGRGGPGPHRRGVRAARAASGRGRRRFGLPSRRGDAPGLHLPGLGPVLPGLRAPAARARRPAEGLPLRPGRASTCAGSSARAGGGPAELEALLRDAFEAKTTWERGAIEGL